MIGPTWLRKYPKLLSRGWLALVSAKVRRKVTVLGGKQISQHRRRVCSVVETPASIHDVTKNTIQDIFLQTALHVEQFTTDPEERHALPSALNCSKLCVIMPQ